MTRQLLLLATATFVLAPASGLSPQSIRLSDKWSTMDQVVVIQAAGLKPAQIGTIRLRSADRAGRVWQSSAEFQADMNGAIDVTRQGPLRGSYTGILPMGLFQSLEMIGPDRGLVRFESQWSDTVRTEVWLEVDGKPVAADTLSRTFASADIRVTAINQDGLVGIRFTPLSTALRGHVLVLGGSEGGLGSADVAAQLANHGFDALALAYFGQDSLPTELAEIPLEYFGNALELLAADAATTKTPIAILGTSKGAEAALLLAVRYPVVSGIVAYAPSSVAWSCICSVASKPSWTWRGKPVSSVPPGTDPDYRPLAGSPMQPAVNYVYRLHSNPVSDARIPVDKTSAKILLIAGSDDSLWPSALMADEIRRLRASRRDLPPVAVLTYQNAGHLIGKSYLPSGPTLIARGRIQTGGTAEGDARAQADSWPRVLDFLSRL